MKVTFKLRSSTGKSASIQLIFNYGKEKRLRYSTGFKVQNKKNWDAKKMEIKNVVEELDRRIVNRKLDELTTTLKTEYWNRKADEGKEVDNYFLKDICDIVLGKVEKQSDIEKLELLPFFKWYMKYHKKNPLATTSKPMGKGTLKTYNNTYNILKRFNDNKYRILYDKIGQKFYKDFMKFMYANQYSTNYIGTQIKILKTILNASYEIGHHVNLEHRKMYFIKPIEVVNHIYLSVEELDKMYDVDLSKATPVVIGSLVLRKEQLDRARDLFIISANTGLRVSDFNRLSKKNIITIDRGKYFQLITQKNLKPVTIPINSQVQSILDKREGDPPERMPDQHINYALKEIGRLAEINSKETIERTVGGVKTKESKFKYELITNHTARRSFCSNAYLSGMPTIDIMAISSHSSEKVFYNYIKVNDIQKAVKISEHKFFK